MVAQGRRTTFQERRLVSVSHYIRAGASSGIKQKPPSGLRKAADKNDVQAQAMLSGMYFQGEGGLAQSVVEAYKWR